MKLISVFALVFTLLSSMAYHAVPAQAGISTDGQGNVKGNKYQAKAKSTPKPKAITKSR
jgi:hypothetical protein